MTMIASLPAVEARSTIAIRRFVASDIPDVARLHARVWPNQTPLHLYDDTAENNFRELFATVRPSLERVAGVEGRIELAKSYAEEQDWINALWTLKDANRLGLLDRNVADLVDPPRAEASAPNWTQGSVVHRTNRDTCEVRSRNSDWGSRPDANR